MRRFRFSLRTLVCFALLAGSSGALWRNWDPWQVSAMLSLGDDSLRGLTISPDGKRIATLSNSKMFLWNAETGARQALCLLDAHPDYNTSLVFSPDSRSVLYTGRAKTADPKSGIFRGCTIQIRDVETGAKKTELATAELGAGMRFNADGKGIINSNRVWELDIETQKERWSFGWFSQSFSGAFNPPDAELDRKIRSAESVASLTDFTRDFLIRGTVSANGKIAATTIIQTNYTQIWNMLDGTRICEIQSNDWDSCLSHDGMLLATRESGDDEIKIWNSQNGNLISRIKGPAYKKLGGTTRCFSQDANLFVFENHEEGTLRAWNTHSGAPIWNIAVDQNLVINQDVIPTFVRDGSRFLFGSCLDDSSQYFVELRDSLDGRLLTRFAGAPETSTGAWFFELSFDGSMIVAVYDDSHAAIWKRQRPEWWWGVAWLPEFWVTLVCAVAFGWSVRREFRAKYPSS